MKRKTKLLSILALMLMAVTQQAWADNEVTISVVAGQLNYTSGGVTVTFTDEVEDGYGAWVHNANPMTVSVNSGVVKSLEMRISYNPDKVGGVNSSVGTRSVSTDSDGNTWVTYTDINVTPVTIKANDWVAFDIVKVIYSDNVSDNVKVTGVTLSPTSSSLTAGGAALELTPTVAPEGATDKTVKWSVEQEGSIVALYTDQACTQAVGTEAIAAAKVYVKPLAAGQATVTVTTNDGAKTATCAVTVNNQAVALSEATDNSSTLTTYNAQIANVTLTRTLQTGGWNTFCVPFDLATPTGWTVKALTASSFNSSTGELTMTFADAASIEAGKPYLVKVTSTVANPTFEGVTISNSTTTTETDCIDFVPVMNPTSLTGGDMTVLFVTGGNKLTYPTADGNINGLRAYFQLKGDAVAEARAFRMSFDDDATGIVTVLTDEPTTASGIYTLDGRRLQGQPAAKGVYIVNGKKTIIK